MVSGFALTRSTESICARRHKLGSEDTNMYLVNCLD